MSVVQSLWASVQGDPVFMRRVNGWFTIFWLAMIPVSIATHWITSVTYVAALSLWALVSGHWSAWQAARVEVNQASEMEARDAEDIPEEVVKRMVKENRDLIRSHQRPRVVWALEVALGRDTSVARTRAIFTGGRIVGHRIRATARRWDARSLVLPLLIAAWIDEQLSVVVIHQMLAELLLRREGPTAHMARTDLPIAPLIFDFRHGASPHTDG